MAGRAAVDHGPGLSVQMIALVIPPGRSALVLAGGRRVGVSPTTALMVPAIRFMSTAPPMPSSLGRVLVVEDEPRVGAMLRDVLVELGYIVKVAVGGAEALQLVPVFEPDVVLLDLLMPEMSWVATARHSPR